MDGWPLFVDTFFRPDLVARYLPSILKAAIITVEVAVLVVATGLTAALLLACIRSFGIRPVNILIATFADVFRTVPPLVLVLLVYFGLPNVGFTLTSIAVLWLVLSVVLTAFAEEILWAGILSIRRGQWEAARSTGLTFVQTLANIVLPQAIRLAIPPLTNRSIVITKNVALVSLSARRSERSPNRIALDRHSSFTDLTQRSA
jgi:polar amino acid transport system permease protein